MRRVSVLLLTLAMAMAAWQVSFASDDQTGWGSSVNGLQMSLRSSKTHYAKADDVIFVVAFQNSETNKFDRQSGLLENHDQMLNLGVRLGNGTQMPTALSFKLTKGNEKPVILQYHGHIPGIAGLLDVLALPLRAGSMHQLSFPLHELALQPIPAGIYQVICSYEGKPTALRNPTFLKFWEGSMISNTIEVTFEEDIE